MQSMQINKTEMTNSIKITSDLLWMLTKLQLIEELDYHVLDVNLRWKHG